MLKKETQETKFTGVSCKKDTEEVLALYSAIVNTQGNLSFHIDNITNLYFSNLQEAQEDFNSFQNRVVNELFPKEIKNETSKDM